MADLQRSVELKIETKGAEGLKAANDEAAKLKKQLTDAEKKAHDLGQEAAQAAIELKKLEAGGIDKRSGYYKSLKAELDAYNLAAKEANLQLKDIKRSYGQATESVKGFGKEAEKSTSAVSSALAKLGGLVAGGKVVGFLKDSLAASLDLQKSLLGLQSVAKRTGNNFDEISENVKKLAADGQASIGGLSKAYGLLLQQGVKADQAFSFLEAGKKLAAFQGITGNVEEDINSFIKALQTGSQELAENLSPALNGAIKSLGGMAAISTDAAKKQELLNLVIKEGSLLTADYETLLGGAAGAQAQATIAITQFKQEVGKGLAPAFTQVAKAGTKVLEFFGELPNFVKASTIAIIGFSAALVPLLGPIGLVVAALGGLAIAIAAIRDEAQNSSKVGKDLYDIQSALKAIDDDDPEAGAKRIELLNKQLEILKKMPDAYRDAATEAKLLTGTENERYEALLKIKGLRETKASDDRVSIDQLKKEILIQKIAQKAAKAAPLSVAAASFDPQRLAQLEDALARRAKGGAAGGAPPPGGGGAFERKSSDFLLNDLARTLKANKQAQDEFNVSLEGYNNAAAQAAAANKRLALDTEAVRVASESVASYYRGEYANSIASVVDSERAALDTLQQLDERGKISAEEFAKSKEAIEEESERRILQIKLDYAERTAQAIAQVNTQAIALIQAQGTSGTLGAVGGLAGATGGALKEGGALAGLGLGALGAGLGIAGIGLGIGAAIFGAIEDAEEEARRKEEERQRRIEAAREAAFQQELKRIRLQNELLNQQIAIEKRINQLAKERQEIQLRIFELDAKNQTDILNKQKAAAEKEAQRLLGVTANKGKAGIGRGGSDLGGGFTSNIRGATQAELQTLATGSQQDKAKVIATIQDRNNASNDARNKLKTLLAAGDKADPNSFNDAIKFYQANKALLTPGERADFETAFGAQIAFLANKAKFDAGDVNLSAAFALQQQSAQLTGAKAQTLEQFLGAPTRIGSALSTGEFLASGIQSTVAQNELLTDARESIVSAAEISNQVAVQKFRDQIESVNLQAAAAATAGKQFDLAAGLAPIAAAIQKELGIESLASLTKEQIEGFGTTGVQFDQFELLLDLTNQIKDSSAATAENTSPELIGQRSKSFLDISRGGFVDRGIFGALGIEGVGLQAPTGAQNLLLTSSASGGQGNPQLATMIAQNQKMIDLLATIAASVDSDAATDPTIGRQAVLSILGDLRSRGIG